MSLEKNINQEIILLVEEFNQKKYDQVIKKSQKFLERGNKISIFYNLIGASYSFKNQHDKAIEFYFKALDLEPNNEELYRNLGKSFIKIKKFDDAAKAFNKSISINPSNADCYFNLGIDRP